MRPLPEGTRRRAEALADRRARADRRPRRSRAAARIARLIGAILAGGGNTRFGGEPKGLHCVDGVRIIDRVAGVLARVTSETILVANAREAEDWLPGMRVARDVRAARGSLVGIHTALTAANDDVAVVAWDMPFVSADLLAALMSRVQDATAAVPTGPHGPEPFCAVYSRAALPFVGRAIEQAELRLGRLLQSLPRLETMSLADVSVFGDPRRLFFNVNTPDDLTAANRMARGG